MNKSNLLLISLLTAALNTAAQPQDDNWYFGGTYSSQTQPGAGLTFASGSPVALTNSAMPYTEGCASYSNSGGELLFYASGSTVYDRTHNVMSNGDSLGGHWSSSQSALIVPVTGDTNLYYLFCNDGSPTGNGTGLYYSMVDMTLNGGFGAVLNPKASKLVSGTSEQLVGCKHANGTDFWAITSEYWTTTLFAFRVTPSGVQPPVITNLGFNASTMGVMKISPGGRKIAIKLIDAYPGNRFLLDFDPATGIFSNPVAVSPPTNINTGCGFAPNDTLFYDIERYTGADSLFQYDITASNVPATRQFAGVLVPKFRFDMRAGPDGKMYIGGDWYTPTLDVIEFPNVPGPGCNFMAGAVSLAGKSPGIMLPNDILVADEATGIAEADPGAGAAAFPNPFSDYLVLKMPAAGETHITLYDMSARALLRKRTAGTATLDTRDLAAGTYLVTVESPGGSVSKHLVVKE